MHQKKKISSRPVFPPQSVSLQTYYIRIRGRDDADHQRSTWEREPLSWELYCSSVSDNIHATPFFENTLPNQYMPRFDAIRHKHGVLLVRLTCSGKQGECYANCRGLKQMCLRALYST